MHRMAWREYGVLWSNTSRNKMFPVHGLFETTVLEVTLGIKMFHIIAAIT